MMVGRRNDCNSAAQSWHWKMGCCCCGGQRCWGVAIAALASLILVIL